MKKLLSVILLFSFLLLFSGCQSSPSSSAAISSAPSPQSSSSSDVTTSDGSPQKGAHQPIAAENISVAVLYAGNPAIGYGSDYSHQFGVLQMQQKLSLKESHIYEILDVDIESSTTMEEALREAARRGAHVIFATNPAFLPACQTVALEFPDTVFRCYTADETRNNNLSTYTSNLDEAWYLAGIAAAINTEANIVGCISPAGKDDTLATRYINAFALGVASVNPDAEVLLKSTGQAFSPSYESAAAQALLDKDCDVIVQQAESLLPLQLADKTGNLAIGSFIDMSETLPKSALTSVLYNWDVYYTRAVQQVIDGTWTSASYAGDFSNGQISLAPLSEAATANTEKKLDEAMLKLTKNSQSIFVGEIKTNMGLKIGSEDTPLTKEELKEMNWYNQNVTIVY